ncbi:dynein regulatory complex protein 1 [Brienomyrus brachyistius]|uniref:dynein regulatory complex protein 1 n=1 Tax=Brienomyrus brachyistius TaxID=42636 RepID=UPI0020B3FBFC|nr:dynein regulatory complex protein 1 [Brienomyrus brachyistius]
MSRSIGIQEAVPEEAGVSNHANKSQVFGDYSKQKQEMKENKDVRRSQKQVEQSERKLLKLQNDGTELITNIQVAGDFKESQRRAELEEASLHRIQKLENEAKICLEKFEEITEKWGMVRQTVVPQDLWESLKSQQALCTLLLEDKNKLIYELQQELKASDEQYVKNLKKQAKDVDLLTERMEEQIRNLMGSYHEELGQIENAFEQERKELLKSNRQKWEEAMKDHRHKELEYLLQRRKTAEGYEMQIQQLRMENAEKCNVTQINLDSKVQMLEQQIQQMKATCQLNQEKLEYNLHVLKKRDEENAVTKSKQKRKITRLQDVMNNLKVRCAKQEKQSCVENQSLTDDYRRIMQQYKHMQKKTRHFVATDSKTFEEIWQMNEAEVKELVKKALETDRLLHEQQLGLAWVPPDLYFMKRSDPEVQQRQNGKSAMQAVADLLKGGGQDQAISSSHELVGLERVEIKEAAESSGISADTLKRLLELLCDETGFLIESKFLKLLSPLEKDEESLMKLESIFLVLGIENEEDMYKLANFFIKYKQRDVKEVTPEGAHGEFEGARLEFREISMSELIHRNDVLKALRTFTSDHCKSREMRLQSKSLSFREKDNSEDSAYWEAMADVIPASRLKIWNALEAALEKYYSVLKERSKLLGETQGLQQQNTELKMLLNQYINAKVRT